MQSFNLTAITPSRQEIVMQQGGKRARIVRGFDPEFTYSAEDLLAIAAMFEGAARMLAERDHTA